MILGDDDSLDDDADNDGEAESMGPIRLPKKGSSLRWVPPKFAASPRWVPPQVGCLPQDGYYYCIDPEQSLTILQYHVTKHNWLPMFPLSCVRAHRLWDKRTQENLKRT